MQDADICIIGSGIMGESDFWIACPLTDFDSMHYYESVQPIIYHKSLPPQHLPYPPNTHAHTHPLPSAPKHDIEHDNDPLATPTTSCHYPG